MPAHSYIGYVTDIPSEDAKKSLIDSVIEEVIGLGYTVVNNQDMFYDEDLFEDISEYTVFYQRIVLFHRDDHFLALEISEKKKETCLILLASVDDTFKPVKELIEAFRKNTPKPKKEKTFYTIGQSNHGFQLEELTIKSEIDPDVIYTNCEDSFVDVDATMQQLILEDKRGLVLFHGDPGTGKTTYIKKLINSG